MAQRPADRQSGFARTLDRSREAPLRSLRLGGDAEPRAYVDPPAGSGSSADALVEAQTGYWAEQGGRSGRTSPSIITCALRVT